MSKRTYRIAFFGSSLVSAYWNGAATYYRGIVKALNDLGHQVTFYEPDAFDRQRHRDIPDPSYARIKVYSAEESEVAKMLRHAEHADIVIKASGVGVMDEFIEAAVPNLKSGDRRVIFWDVDAPATLERIASDDADPFHRVIADYDVVITYGGGNPVVEAYRKRGAAECIAVYNALDPESHFKVSPDARFEAALGFLGNRMPDREERVFEFFFKPTRILPHKRFVLGGNGWDSNVPESENVHYLGHVYTRDHNAFNCTPDAVLNINRASMAAYGYSPPTRIFEAAGSGACIITDAWKGIEMFLEPESECLTADSGEDVAAHLERLDAVRADNIGSAARKRILAEHTYRHRGRQVEKIFDSLF